MRTLFKQVFLGLSICAFASGTGKAQDLIELEAYNNAPKASVMLKAFYAVPENPENKPLVVLLHGCGQDAQKYWEKSGWKSIYSDKFAVLAIENRNALFKNCFQWFVPNEIERGRHRSTYSQAESIVLAVELLQEKFSLDKQRTYVTGLSAGAGMSVALLATYPDVFEAGAPVAGLPYQCDTLSNLYPIPVAQKCMQNPKTNVSAQEWGRRVITVGGKYAPEGKWPRMAVWHGNADKTVAYQNAINLENQWRTVVCPSCSPIKERMESGIQRTTYRTGNQSLLEVYTLPNFPHALPVGSPPSVKGCGVVDKDGWFEDGGICSSSAIATFFGLD